MLPCSAKAFRVGQGRPGISPQHLDELSAIFWQFDVVLPLLALVGLVHLGVTRLVCILGGTECANDSLAHEDAS